MNSKSLIWKAVLVASFAASAWAGTFGRTVAIGGHASDLALDEGRGVLYIANFTANRIDVMNLSDNTIQRSINVPAQPSSLALSPDGKYLVIAHYGNFAAPSNGTNALTSLNLETNSRQTLSLGSPPLGVAFGIDNIAFVATTTQFLLFDPILNTTSVIETIPGLVAKTLPQPAGAFPPNITAASTAASRDGLWIIGSTDKLDFLYDVNARQVSAAFYVSVPPNGPRTVAANADGTVFSSGWALEDRNFNLISEFPNPVGTFNVGSTIFDSSRGLIYAQMPPPAASGQSATGASTTTSTQAPPFLQVVRADNLAVLTKLNLAENLAGKSVITSDNNTVYAISDSGVTVFPVGALGQQHQITASAQDVVFRGNFCNNKPTSQDLFITDKSGGSSDFSISSDTAGVQITPSSGITPAHVRVTVDPAAFQNQTGSAIATLTIKSGRAINIPDTIRVTVNNRQPDQRGTFIDVPGKLVDILPDPARQRFYILRQNTNEVLVFDSTTNSQITALATGNTPTQMAITFDQQNLLVGSNDSQLLYVYDLNTLQATTPVRMPGGHYPKSVAASANAILVANRVAGPKHTIDRVDLNSRTATQLPSLGVYTNDININTYLVASPNGSSIMAVEADGSVLLYDANADTFTISRKDLSALSGAYGASSFGQFFAGSSLLNQSLVPVAQLDTGIGSSSGFAFVDRYGIRATAPNSSSPGTLQRIDLSSGGSSTSARIIEAPILSDMTIPFTRTLAPLSDRSGIIALTTSGFTVLPWNFDAATTSPHIDSVVSAADSTAPIAPGGLVTIFGSNLSPISQTTTGGLLPTSLGDSCLQVNGLPVPVLFVSPKQINAQLPNIMGNTTLRLATPGGISDNFNLTILPNAPSVFLISVTGNDQTPAIIRASNNLPVTPTNPVHRGDVLVIYATGLGRTSPDVAPGTPAPLDQLASVLVPPIVTIGGVAAQVLFAGLVPGQIGEDQINVRVPSDTPLGLSIPLQINQGAGSTSVAVRVVQ